MCFEGEESNFDGAPQCAKNSSVDCFSVRGYSRHLHHVVASVISLAATFFAKVTSRSFCCASFSPQNLAARFFAGSLCLFAAPETRTSFEVRVLFSHALKSDWTVKRSPLPGIGSGLSVLSISLRNYTLIHCFSLNYLYQNNRFSFRL